MPVVDWAVKLGYSVEARDGELGVVQEVFNGPAQSLFLSTDSFMRVVDRGQPDLSIPFTEIVDISDVKRTIYLKRWLREINALGWTRDPRQPGRPAAPFFPKPKSAAAVKPDANGSVPPRALVESGAYGSATASSPVTASRCRLSTCAPSAGFGSTAARCWKKIQRGALRRPTTRVACGSWRTYAHRALT